MTGTETIIGIDVSKAYLDLWVRPGGRAWRCDYGEAELSEVVLELSRLEPDGIIVEATGGLEVPLVAELSAADLPVVVVNPRQVREFGRASGRLAKTDPDGRPAAGGLWSHDAAGGKAVARRVLAGVAGAGDAPAAAHRDADPGAQPETTSAGASGPADPGAPGPVG